MCGAAIDGALVRLVVLAARRGGAGVQRGPDAVLRRGDGAGGVGAAAGLAAGRRDVDAGAEVGVERPVALTVDCAATVITLLQLAGVKFAALALELPAATTTVVPRLTAPLMAFW